MKFMVCPLRQGGRGVEPVQTFFGQGRKGGQFFAILCDNVLYGLTFNILYIHGGTVHKYPVSMSLICMANPHPCLFISYVVAYVQARM